MYREHQDTAAERQLRSWAFQDLATEHAAYAAEEFAGRVHNSAPETYFDPEPHETLYDYMASEPDPYEREFDDPRDGRR